jgi:hypothetical protein
MFGVGFVLASRPYNRISSEFAVHVVFKGVEDVLEQSAVKKI